MVSICYCAVIMTYNSVHFFGIHSELSNSENMLLVYLTNNVHCPLRQLLSQNLNTCVVHCNMIITTNINPMCSQGCSVARLQCQQIKHG